MKNSARTAIVSLLVAATLPLTAWSQASTSDASHQILAIIYSDLSKREMLDRLAEFVGIGDKLSDIPTKTGLDLGICLGGGPGVVDCHLSNGLQLVADPDGVVQVIRRDTRVVDGRKFNEMSISTPMLQWKGYARGYPE